eukprot:3303615-Rhodomonas_salina.1
MRRRRRRKGKRRREEGGGRPAQGREELQGARGRERGREREGERPSCWSHATRCPSRCVPLPWYLLPLPRVPSYAPTTRLLRAPYGKSGTDAAYGATAGVTEAREESTGGAV